jgi:hypothetical protein
MKLMALLAVALVAACGADAPMPTTPLASQPAQLDATALATRSLGVSSLPGMRLLATPSGRDALARIVSCALPRGASITAITSSGTPYSFTGETGLAPSWAQRAPTAVEHQRVTACVQARTAGLIRV